MLHTRTNSVPAPISWSWALIFLLLASAACTPAARDAAGSTPAPTIVLIAPTATLTPTPLPPTDTPAPDTGLLASTLGAVLSPTPTLQQGLATPIADPGAASLASLAQRLLSESLDLPQRRVRVTGVEVYTWGDTSLGCPLPGQAYTQVETNGYRLVLSVGDRDYFYHTDVDRVVLCAPENEVLPAGTPTPRPTFNITPGATAQQVG